jgi:hypothetical protein
MEIVPGEERAGVLVMKRETATITAPFDITVLQEHFLSELK